MFGENVISGPGYTVQVPPGFVVAGGVPAAGIYQLMPPGVSPSDVQALLQIRPVQEFEVQPLIQNLYTFENPMVAQSSAANLGLVWVLGMLPMRQMAMPQGQTYIREFDAMNAFGFRLRVMALVMIGPQSAVEVVVMMNLFRWTAFVGPCLSFLGQIQLQGAGQPSDQQVAQQSSQLQAVVDPNHENQIEYQLVTPGHAPVALTSLPTIVGGTVIINVDNSIKTGNINGTGIALGQHSTATVTQDNAATAAGD
jgi:hypothetical protein